LRAPPRRVLLAAQLIVAALVLYFIGRALVAQWTAFRDQPLETRLSWAAIGASAAVVLISYAILIQTWRTMLRGWSSTDTTTLSFGNAARIWCISNLGRYVPGKVWQIMSMSAMASRAGVSPVASAGSALVNTVVNIATGLAIALALGWSWIDRFNADARVVAVLLVILATLGLAFLPTVMPRLSAIVARLTGRDIALGSPPHSVIAIGVGGNIVAWILYGVAFQLLVRGVLGAPPGALWLYIAVFTASYVVGYLFLFLPGGIGPREGTMVVLLTALQLTTNKQAWVIAGASRIWLTVLEIAPGLLFWATDAARRPSNPSSTSTPDAPIK
jgi:hypothetical protein